MAVDIPEAFHLQLTEFDAFNEVSQVGREEVKASFRLAEQALGPAKPQPMPSVFPAELTPEESNACWKQAKKELLSKGVADKHAIQRRAIELIQQASFTKASRLDQEAARKRDKVTMPNPKKKKKRIRLTPEVSKPAESAMKRPIKQRPIKQSVSKMLRVDEPEPVKKRSSINEPYEISLTYNDMTVTTRAVRVIDDPDNVVLMLASKRRKQLLHIVGARDTEFGELMISYKGQANFRNVLIRPFRFQDNNTIYILFVVVPDGA
jgi:hypothetical protein